MSPFFKKFNQNPWKKNIPDCAIRAVSLAANIPYVEVCKRLGVSFRKGHGLIRNSGLVMEKIKEVFDENFDIVVDFDERLPEGEMDEISDAVPFLFDDEDDDISNQSEQTLAEWIQINHGTGTYVVGVHNSTNTDGHLVCVSTDNLKFYDTWDCSNWKVDCWCRVRKREHN